MTTLIETLGDFVYNLKYDDLSPEVVSMTKLSVLHHLYTGFNGIKESDSQIALSLVRDELRGVGNSTILGQKEKTSALGATFANTVLMHSVQQEDTLRGLHPGPHTISTALALGEQEGSNGRNFLTSIVAGYEVNLKVGEICAKYSSPRAWRGTTIYGVLGSTATAAKMLRLDQEQTMDALAMATNLASGLMQCWLTGTPEWLFTSGLAAQNGVMSALLAKKGSKGAMNSFEGDSGFYKAYCGVSPETADEIAHTIGNKFSTLDIILKPYSVITTILPVIHNIVVLATQMDINHEDIKEVRVTAGTRVTDGPLSSSILDNGPFLNKTQAYKSLPCAIGIALRFREVTPMSVENYQDSSISEIAKRVRIETDHAAEGFFNVIRIVMKDGTVHTIEGDDFPTLGPEVVQSNFKRAASEYISRPKAEQLSEAILRVDQLSIAELSKLLT